MHKRLHQNTKGSKVRHTHQMRQGVHQTPNSSVRMLAIHQQSKSRLNTSAFELNMKGNLCFLEALSTSVRIKITYPNATWKIEFMPRGTVGWEQAMNAVLNPFFYKPKNENGSWFEVMNPSTISRMYHSSTVLLRDGRVIVGISNPHKFYEFTPSFYPTKLTLEAFSPPYLDPMFAPLRLKILEPTSQTNLKYVNETLMIESVCVTMLAPPLNTHSFSMNQRLLVLATTKFHELHFLNVLLVEIWEIPYNSLTVLKS
ncbi:hypothetical protein Lal_00004451 [Lupinus albus]|nr:hypothetical protein Lal_00004451 [Lupinus albus]